MSFIDSFHWGWVFMPLFFKACLPMIFILCLIVSFVTLCNKDTSGAILIFIHSLILPALFYMPSPPTTEGLVSMYEYGEINKSELVKFLPYAIEFDEKEAKDKKAYETKKKNEEKAIKKEEASRRNEALALVKKIKEEG